MKEQNEKALVLRTVYLNQELRKMAIHNRMSKGELIRRLLNFALHHKAEFEKGLGAIETVPETIPSTKDDSVVPKDKRNKLVPAPTRKK